MPLVAGTDIHVIACLRGSLPAGSQEWVFGVRWAGRPDLGFPTKGFVLRRLVQGAAAPVVAGRFFLPATQDWPAFAADAEARRPAMGPYFPDLLPENLEYLLPIIRLADPRTARAEFNGLIERASDFFGSVHAGDPGLAWAFLPGGDPPPIADLLADPAAAAALAAYYRGRCTTYLLALALRFEYAVLLGLATDDLTPAGPAEVNYHITGHWSETGTSTTSLDDPKPACVPPPPDTVGAKRIPGDVAHPAFAAFSDWVAPAALRTLDAAGEPLPSSALVPRVPAAFTGLSWSAPEPSQRLIGYGPVLYAVSRFEFGAGTAALLHMPPLPQDALFERLFGGEPLLRPTTEPHAVDNPGMDWPPLEGHYVYDVRGISLLGFVSKSGTIASVRHHDDIPPAAPRARLAGEQGLMVDASGRVSVDIRVDWDSGEDFISPDVSDFRLSASFTPLEHVAVDVAELLDADPLTCTIAVADLSAQANAHAGRRLILPNGEFVIVAHGTGAATTMRVRRSAGRTPAVGVTGIILAPGAPTALTRVARLARSAAVATRVDSIVIGEHVEVGLAPAPGPQDQSGRIYLHLLRSSFDAERSGANYRLTPSPPGAPGAEQWDRWLGLADRAEAMVGSPALFFPPHRIESQVDVPEDLMAGTLTLQVTAADATLYVDSPALPSSDPALLGLSGNESAPSQVLASVRRLDPPDVPSPVFDPAIRLWATSAASYAEAARFDLAWAPVAGALRYEVWRVLEGGLAGASAATGDAELRALGAGQPGAFELRSADVFGTHHIDDLPGRAPTRALYRVRAVSPAGIAGAFSGVIGPVYVPDVRPPPAPNLLRVVAVDPEDLDRAIAVEWTQASLDGDLRFEVEVREAGPATRFTTAAVIPRGTPSVSGRFRFVHPDRVPGRRYEYRVLAVREAPDPADPAGADRRDIRSLPSRALGGVAISTAPVQPPVEVTASWNDASSSISLSWVNVEAYDALLIHRRAPGRFGFEQIAVLEGTADAHDDAVGLATGTWSYQIRARTASREARSAIVEAIVP